MPARLPEHRAEQLGRAVDHTRLAGEAGGGRHEADHLHHAGDRVQPDQLIDGGEGVERASAGQVVPLLGLISAPTLPVAASTPSTNGTWPAVNTSEPLRRAGM